MLVAVRDVLAGLRKKKSEAKRPMKAKIARATVRRDPAVLERLKLAERDLAAAAGVAVFEWVADAAEGLDVEFAEDPPAGAPA